MGRHVHTAVLCIACMLIMASAGVAACAGEGPGPASSDEQRIGFIVSHYRLLQGHRERCDALVEDFESRWRSAPREDAFPVLGMLSSVEGDIVWALVVWERMAPPESDDVARLDEAFFDYLDLVLASSRLVSRALGSSYRSGPETRARAARDAAVSLASARDAEARLAALMRAVERGADD